MRGASSRVLPSHAGLAGCSSQVDVDRLRSLACQDLERPALLAQLDVRRSGAVFWNVSVWVVVLPSTWVLEIEVGEITR